MPSFAEPQQRHFFAPPLSHCVSENTHYIYYIFMSVSTRHKGIETRKAICRLQRTLPYPPLHLHYHFSIKVAESDFNDAKMRYCSIWRR